MWMRSWTHSSNASSPSSNKDKYSTTKRGVREVVPDIQMLITARKQAKRKLRNQLLTSFWNALIHRLKRWTRSTKQAKVNLKKTCDHSMKMRSNRKKIWLRDPWTKAIHHQHQWLQKKVTALQNSHLLIIITPLNLMLSTACPPTYKSKQCQQHRVLRSRQLLSRNKPVSSLRFSLNPCSSWWLTTSVWARRLHFWSHSHWP